MGERVQLVIPADPGLEPGESRDPWHLDPSDRMKLPLLYGSRIAACGGFRDDIPLERSAF